jgi:hypothetical protein
VTDRRLQPDGAFAEWWRELFSVEGYDLQRVLAYGPGWETFEARVASGGEPVTLKVFTGLAAPDRRTRFLRAAERRASLKHPNLLAVQNFGETAGCAFLALELAACPSLAARLRTQALDPEECVDILFGVADAVEMAAQHGIITRDLAPDTILVHLLRGGLLGDLGIAQEVVGRIVIADDRLAYRSPEELRGEEIDLRASVYSLGAVAITALTRAPPHRNSRLRAGHRFTHGPLGLPKARPFLPREIHAVVTRAMAHAPEDRYANTSEFMRCMAHGLTASGEATRAAPPRRHAALGLGSTPPTLANGRARNVRPSASHRALRLRAFARLRAPVPYVARAGSITRGGRAGGPTLPWLRPRSAYHLSRASAVARGLWEGATTRAWPLVIRASRMTRDTAVSLGVRQWAAVAAALLALIATGAVGWLLAGGGGSVEPEASVAVNKGLRLQLPPGWTRGDRAEAVPAPAGAIVAYPPGDRGSGTIAFATGSSPGEMAERLLARTGSAPARLSVARSGSFGGWRYAPLRFGARAEGTGFVLPTTTGSIVVICYTSNPSGTGRLPFSCRRIAAGASPLSGRLVTVQAASPAGRDLTDSINQLRRRRAAALRRLTQAKRSEFQARVAGDLERAYFAAARAVAALPGERNELGRLTDALRRAGTAYGDLARAAALEDAPGYEAARVGIRAGEQGVRKALEGMK